MRGTCNIEMFKADPRKSTYALLVFTYINHMKVHNNDSNKPGKHTALEI